MTTGGKNTIEGEKMMVFIHRIEAEDKLKQVHADNIAAIKAEAKASGFMPKALSAVVAARKLKPSLFREGEDIRDVYFHAAGLADPPPLFRQIEALKGDDLGRAAVIESMKSLVPPGGSIIVELDGPPVKLSRAPSGEVTVEEVKPPAPPKAAGAAAPPARDVPPPPDCNEDEAEELGADAFRNDEPITSNPFPYGDKRQPRWDRGWRSESGNDGSDH